MNEQTNADIIAWLRRAHTFDLSPLGHDYTDAQVADALEGREPEWEYECRPHPAYDWRPCGMPEGCARERRRRRSAGPWEPVEGEDKES